MGFFDNLKKYFEEELKVAPVTHSNISDTSIKKNSEAIAGENFETEQDAKRTRHEDVINEYSGGNSTGKHDKDWVKRVENAKNPQNINIR